MAKGQQHFIIEARPGLADLAKRFEFQLLVQFGSSVGGVHHAHSDLDLAVQFTDAEVPIQTLIELREALQDLFPAQDIDLAIINHADPLFLKKITERYLLLYGTPRDLALLRLYAFRRYQDHRRFLELERRYVTRSLAALQGALEEPPSLFPSSVRRGKGR